MYIPKKLEGFAITAEEATLLKADALLKRINKNGRDPEELNMAERVALCEARKKLFNALLPGQFVNGDQECSTEHLLDIVDNLDEKRKVIPFRVLAAIADKNKSGFAVKDLGEEDMFRIMSAITDADYVYKLLKIVDDAPRLYAKSGHVFMAKSYSEIRESRSVVAEDPSYGGRSKINVRFKPKWIFAEKLTCKSLDYTCSYSQKDFPQTEAEEIIKSLLQLHNASKIPEEVEDCFVVISKYDDEDLKKRNEDIKNYKTAHAEWEKKMVKIRELQELYEDKEKYPDLPEPQSPENNLTKYNYVILSRKGKELLSMLEKFVGEKEEPKEETQYAASYREVLRPYIGKELSVRGIVAESDISEDGYKFVIVRDVYLEDGTYVCDHMWMYDRNIVDAELEIGKEYRFTGAVEEYKIKDSDKINVAVRATVVEEM